MSNEIRTKAEAWLSESFDAETRAAVQDLLDNKPQELTECFYQDLEFGTGGMRGKMGVGTNRVNIYTIGMATQGLANYMKQHFPVGSAFAVAHDCRNNSALFSETTAKIMEANGFKAYMFDALRPTPELSYAIRELGCKAGVVITASHNPKEYNGYKVYWDDGGQVIAPHDANIIAEVRKISSPEQVNFDGNLDNVEVLGDAFDQKYLDELAKLSLSAEAIKAAKDMKIVFTPIHGTGVKLVPDVLRKIGFANVINVPEQDVVDGNFPTVISPNPENAEALKMALAKAETKGADLVMATDPDADRVGIAVRDNHNKLILLNGNQTGALLLYYLLNAWKENGKLNGNQYIVKTIVTTELLVDMANKFNVEYFDVLTGFKFIANIIKENEGKKQFIGGGEESYGYLAGEFVRDKDAVMSCMLIAETAAWAKQQGKTMYELLADIYVEFGFYKEHLVNVVREGKAGAEEIAKMMEEYRSNPPKSLAGSAVVELRDFNAETITNTVTGNKKPSGLPKSNVLQFLTADGTKVSVRPSGTEPKIKFYFGVKTDLSAKEKMEEALKVADAKIDGIVKELNL